MKPAHIHLPIACLFRWVFCITVFTGPMLPTARGQMQQVPLAQALTHHAEGLIQTYAPELHLGTKPLSLAWALPEASRRIDSLLYPHRTDPLLPAAWQQSWLWRKLRNEHLVDWHSGQAQLRFDPLLVLQQSRTPQGQSYLTNTRGVAFAGTLGPNLSFYSAFFENQAYFPPWIDQRVFQTGMVPGLGSPKPFGEGGHDYSRTEAWLELRPVSSLALQLGHGKLFVGHGYRSLLLSDNAFVYPYLRATWRYKNWQWMWAVAQFTDFGKPMQTDRVWQYEYHFRRIANLQTISYKPSPLIEVAVFEGVMWQSTDTAARVYNQLRLPYFAPIPLLATATQGLDGANNVVLGLQLQLRPMRHWQIYAQAMLDNLEGGQGTNDRYGWQLGTKAQWHYAKHGIWARAEYNYVRPYAYGHALPRSNWSHSNQALAHPLGANFAEWLVRLRYQWADLVLEAHLSQAQTGIEGPGEHFGSSIYSSTTLATAPERYTGVLGSPHSVQHVQLTAALLVNPRTQLQLFGSWHRRSVSGPLQSGVTELLSVGLRSNLFNSYIDF